MKRFYKILLYVLLFLTIALLVVYFIFNKPLPKGEKGEKARALAAKMQTAINQEAWENTRYVEWTFYGHHYLWDKKRHYVQVKWDKIRVLLDPTKIEGLVYVDGQKVERPDLIKKANSYFINDAFWLNAPAQIFGRDENELKLEAVLLEDGSDGLLVTYLTGGDTPGDAYLWILDEDGLPKAWQLWVDIIPIGGLEVSWDKWTTLPSGAKIATLHEGLLPITITNLKSYQEAERAIFAELEK